MTSNLRSVLLRLALRTGLVGVTIALVACSNPAPTRLTSSDARGLANARIATVQRETPPFKVKSVTEGALGLVPQVGPIVSKAASVRAGRKVVEANGLADPATYISQKLALNLSRQCGTSSTLRISVLPKTNLDKAGAWLNSKFSSQVTSAMVRESTQELVQACFGSDYLLDVRTIDWSVGFYRTNWCRYKVRYSSELRLIEIRSGKLIAGGKFTYSSEKSKSSPRYNALLANHAAVLQQELRAASDASVEYFMSSVLGFSTSSAQTPGTRIP